MSTLNCINFRVEKKIKAYVFVPFMFGESSLISNISIFEDHNIVQIDINKTDKC